MRAGKRRLNLPALRGFLMAALHWHPHMVLHEVTLRDIHEAFCGWRLLNAAPVQAAERPDKTFMLQMMQQFPDQPPERKAHNGR